MLGLPSTVTMNRREGRRALRLGVRRTLSAGLCAERVRAGYVVAESADALGVTNSWMRQGWCGTTAGQADLPKRGEKGGAWPRMGSPVHGHTLVV